MSVSPPPSPLVSYIAPGAPATRRPASGDEPFLRPEVGFTPKWYREALGISFGEAWHTDVAYRRESVLAMRGERCRRFADTQAACDGPLDLLTGVFGACTVAAIYGVPILYTPDNWPNCEHAYLSEEEVTALEPPDLDENGFFQGLMAQVDQIEALEGKVEGYINWQGVLNNAYRLRGEELFTDLIVRPELCSRLFDCVCETMIDAASRLHTRQRESGVQVDFFTVSNCLVNMLSPGQYRDFLLPCDQRIAEAFGCIGIHNCAWNADPYLESYAEVPHVAYIDMGLESDLVRARERFPEARRALMYTPMDLAGKPMDTIRADLERIAVDYGPCDLVLADIEDTTPDERVLEVLELCGELSQA